MQIQHGNIFRNTTQAGRHRYLVRGFWRRIANWGSVFGLVLAGWSSSGDGVRKLLAQEPTPPAVAAGARGPRNPWTPSFNETVQIPESAGTAPRSGTPAAAAGTAPAPTPTASGGGAQGGPATGERRATQLGDRQLGDQVPATGWQQVVPGASAAPAASGGPVGEITQVSKTFSALPADAGQVWREYDITPYTSQVPGEQPQQAVIDWVLKQTGKDMWFAQPLGILNATRDKLIVYHTPEIHNEIRPLVDRFVYTRGQKQTATVHLVTVANPNWREAYYRYLQPIEVNSPQVEGWLISKENAALLLNELSQRSDFKSHANGPVTMPNGQSFEFERRTPVQFLRALRWTPEAAPGFQPLLTQINEGYSLSLSLLTSLDGRSIEASVTCQVDQVERLTTVKVPVGGQAASGPGGLFGGNNGGERMNLQVPQLVSWRLHERVRWPVDQVLVLSCGVVAAPGSEGPRPLGGILEGRSQRADALLFIDFRGAADPNAWRDANRTPAPAGLQPISRN